MNSQNRPMSFSYLLAITLLYIIQKSGGTIYERLNLSDVAFSQIKALTTEDTSDEHKTSIAEVETNITELREAYSDDIESHSENSGLFIEERTEIETRLYKIITDLFTIIGSEKLIQDKTYGEVIAQKWLQ